MTLPQPLLMWLFLQVSIYNLFYFNHLFLVPTQTCVSNKCYLCQTSTTSCTIAGSTGTFLLDNCGICNGTTTGSCTYKSITPNTNPNRNYANSYTASDLFKKPGVRYQYIYDLLWNEGKFHQHGVAFDVSSGLTYDGRWVDTASLNAQGVPRNWSSPAKESLHIHLLALTLSGNELAQHFI